MERIESKKKSISSSFSWKLLERFFSVGVSIIIQIVLARIVSTTDFGSLALLVAIINFASIFVSSGISTAIIQKKELEQDDISTTMTMCMFVALLVYLVLFFLAPIFADYYETPELKWGLRVLSIIIFFNSFNSIQIALLSRKMNFKTIFIRSAIAVPLSGAIGIILALNGFGIWALIIHTLSTSFLTVLIMAIGSKERIGLRFSFSRAKKIYSFSGFILFAALIAGLRDTFRSLIIGKKYSKEELAFYNKGYTYSTYVAQIGKESVSSVLLPAFSTEQSNYDRLLEMGRKSFRLITFVSLPLLVGFALVSYEFVHIVLTDKWINAVPFLCLFFILRLFDLIKSIDIQMYFAVGKSKLYFVFSSIVSLVDIGLVFVALNLGSIYIAGAAVIVEAISTIVAFIISGILFKYSFVERIKDCYKPLIACTVMIGLVLVFNLLEIDNCWITLFSKIGIGAVSYIGIELLLRDGNIKDCLAIIKRLLKKKEQSNDAEVQEG